MNAPSTPVAARSTGGNAWGRRRRNWNGSGWIYVLNAESGRGGPRLERWTGAGWLEERNGRWVATIEGWLRLDAIVAELAGAEGR